MKINLDLTKLPQRTRTNDFSFSQQNQYRQPTAGVDGVSFPSSAPRRFVAVTTIIALGTVSLGTHPVDLTKFQGMAILLPNATRVTPPAERYAQLRENIVASGVPLLNDEDLRAEIRERRGVKSEPES